MRAAEMPATAANGARRTRTRRARNGDSVVNHSLTPRTQYEAADVAAATGRMLRALSRRAEAGDLQALACLRDLERTCVVEQLRAAHALSVTHGYSWAQIGLACGVTKQAAHSRWGL